MIYYFSGTGNSEWVAKELARLTFDTAESITSFPKDGPFSLFHGKNKPIGLVFPIYAWNVPNPMMQFAQKLASQGSYHFAVCTCGDDAGYSMRKLHKVFPLQSCYSISMPNNYILGYDVDSSTVEKKKIDAAKLRIQKISEDIKLKKKVYEVHEGKSPGFKTNIISFLFQHFARSTKPFYVEESCNGCRLCEKNCPSGTITVKDNRPVWGKECYQCLSCIHRCPKKAIQYGKSTAKKGRYFFGHS